MTPRQGVGPPVVVLGVSRSGTTLLKEMLDSHPELAIPGESYFIPQLWDRHGERPDREELLADLERLAVVRDWGLSRDQIAGRMPAEPRFEEAIGAIYRAYADARGKPRFGDKTPSYMQRLAVLDRAFPRARYVHLVRDGRDAALSFLSMKRRPRFNWARPRGVGAFAAQWRREVAGARAFGAGPAAGRYLEVRYEDLVAGPQEVLEEVCGHLELRFDPKMLTYHQRIDTGMMPDHPVLAEPPRPGLRRWSEQMSSRDARLFEAIAGDQLAAFSYDGADPGPSPALRLRGRAERAALAVRIRSFDLALGAIRRSPAWRLRQAYVRRTS